VGQAVFVILPDSHAAFDRLERGEFDLVRDVPAQRLERLAANPSVRLVKTGGLNLRFLGMRLERAALKDRRVREAIVRAIDVDRLAAHTGRGTMLAAQGPLPPSSLGYESQLRQPSYDPERARSLLQDAGAARLNLRLLYNASLEYWSESVQAIRADLRKVGISVELLGVKDWTAFHDERKKGGHDLYLYGWAVSTPDPERFLLPLYQSQSPDNFGRYANPGVDDLLAQARHPMEDSRRLRLYRDAARLIVADIPAVFLFHTITFTAHSTRVTGLSLNQYGWPLDKLTTVEMR
jgi:ABC-type transport system substrate-binding protein